MPLHDDTPPKGDYAAYIEKLTQRSQAGNSGLPEANAGNAGSTRKPAAARAIQLAAQKALQEAKRKAAQASADGATATSRPAFQTSRTSQGNATPRQSTAASVPAASDSLGLGSAWQAQKASSQSVSTGNSASYGNYGNVPESAAPNAADSPQEKPEAASRKKRSNWPLLIAILVFVPLFNIVGDMLNNPRPEGLFFIIVAVFVIFSIRHSIKSGDEPDKGKKRPAIKKDDDYPNTGH